MTDNNPKSGAGPFTFEVAELAPGESWTADFRNREKNGQKHGFRRFMPFDAAQVSNVNTTTYVDVEFNGQYQARVLSNAVESFDRQGVTEVSVTNPASSSTTIPAGEVVVEVVKEPYGADDAALDRANQGVLGGVVEKFTGVPPEALFGGNR